MALNLGGIIRLTYAVKSDVGVLTNPGTATLAITQPDGTVAAGTTVTLPPVTTGLLLVDFTPAQAGLHAVHWATTGPTTAEDDVFVAERPGSLLVSVDEAVNHLRAEGVIGTDAEREQLQWLCLVVSEAVEGDLGRAVVRRTVVETHTGGGSALVLRQSPVISITSTVESGVALTTGQYLLESPILYRATTAGLSRFAYGVLNVVVTYVAGYANPPRSVRMVALTALQSMYQLSQQASHPLLDESAELAVTSAIGGLPDPLRNAYESLRAPGIA